MLLKLLKHEGITVTHHSGGTVSSGLHFVTPHASRIHDPQPMVLNIGGESVPGEHLVSSSKEDKVGGG